MATQKSPPPSPLIPSVEPTFPVAIDRLRFDPENPRFVDFTGNTDFEIVKFLYDDADLDELVQSISSSGYIDFEPLLVLKENDDYIVLEGNRRLGAVRLLRSPELQQELGVTVGPLSSEIYASMDDLRVLEMQTRVQARAFIGFKHINGPHKWDSMAKAKYAAEWLKDGGDIKELSRTLGDTHNTVRRLVFGWMVLKEAEDNGYNLEQRMPKRFSFSHLYTALSRPGFRSYVGLSEDPADTPLKPNPIAPENLSKLREMMVWLYGDKNSNTSPVIKSQYPDLNRLNEVLQHKEARQFFLSRENLNEAHAIIEPKSVRFSDALIAALQSAKEALSYVPEYDQDTALIDNARSLNRTARLIVKSMEDMVSEKAQV